MSDNSVKWTPQQRNAINSRGDVLVTASAGTGKTAVLSRRCVEIISDSSKPVDVNKILVLTFTEAAAEEMKSRIAQTLREEYYATKNPWLKKQVLLLDGADISTIHSFCKRIITDNFFELGIDPAFKLIDTDEQMFLKAEILEAVVEEAWSDPELKDKMGLLLHKRKVKDITNGFLGTIITVSEMLTGVISKADWFELARGKSIEDAKLRQKEIIEKRISRALSQLEHVEKLDQKLLESFYAENILNIKSFVEDGLAFARKGNFASCLNRIEELSECKKLFKNRPRGSDPLYYEFVRDMAKGAVDEFKALKSLALMNPEYESIVADQADAQTRIFLILLEKFEHAYQQRKLELNCMDFSDLEHYALKLLRSDDGTKTKAAMDIAGTYEYVFVDEYQDVNQVQDAIVRMISKGENLFVVGDVKQSIYAWRQARPEIFLDHLKSASKEKVSGMEQRLDLSSNFRSRKEILDFANDIFSKLMSESMCKMDYDEDSYLVAGAKYETISDVSKAGAVDKAVELYLLDENASEDDADQFGNSDENSDAQLFSSAQKQAGVIAKRIKEIIGDGTGSEFKILDRQTKQYRNVDYGDIVILMRSLSVRVNDFVEILRMAGIPVSSSVSGGYFATTEITDIISLLKVLDNTHRDIELASVLRSPLFSVSDTELAMIRLEAKRNKKKQSFYDDVTDYSQNGPDEKLQRKLREIIKNLEDWQLQARRGNLADLIWHVIRKTGYLSFVSALPNGKQRRANLIKLHERAIQFEGFISSGKTVSLTRFVEFVEKLYEQGGDWTEAEPDSGTEQSVRIMSIHKSKGLEFPVVFLAGLEKKFNLTDSYGDCLCDDTLTLGLRIVDSENNVKLNSLRHQVIAESITSTSVAEELRILYVAVTRARERLILVGSMPAGSASELAFSSAVSQADVLPDWMLRKGYSHLHWILAAIGGYDCVHEVLRTNCPADLKANELLHMSLFDAEEISQICGDMVISKKNKSRQKDRLNDSTQADDSKAQELFAKLKKDLVWKYKFTDCIEMPAKSSVSRLTHSQDEYAIRNFTNSLEKKPAVIELGDESIDSRVVGTASHLFMQKVDLARAKDFEYLQSQLESLVQAGEIPESVAKKINLQAAAKFFESDIAGLLYESQNRVYREWPFTFLYKENEQGDGANDDGLIVQGIIDLLIVGPERLWVVDFKTDSVNPAKCEAHSEIYRKQIELYGRAAQAVWNKPLEAGWLYYLKCAKDVQLI